MIKVESSFIPGEDEIGLETHVTVLQPNTKILPQELVNYVLSVEVYALLKELYWKDADIVITAFEKLTEEVKDND